MEIQGGSLMRTVKEKKKYYIAYGSNLNIAQMARRCPKAKRVGKIELKGWKMEFRGTRGWGVATIVKCSDTDSVVPCGIWQTTKNCEKNLDSYEGFPTFYRKENMRINLNGKLVDAYVYIMNEGRPKANPSEIYYNTIKIGYQDFGFDEAILDGFVSKNKKEAVK